MRRNFSIIKGFFISQVLVFSTNLPAKDRPMDEKFRPELSSEIDTQAELTNAKVLQNGQLVASRNSDNSIDRAFGKMDKRRAKSQRTAYWYLLPLGIPQFAEGYRGIGSAFAVGQVGSLALYYDRMKKVDAGNQAATETTRNLTPQQAAQNPFVVSFLNQNEKSVKDAQTEQKYFLFAFIGLYGLSIYEALYDPLDMRKLDGLRKKNRDKDRDPSGRDDDMRERNFDDDEEALNNSRSRARFGFMVLPSAKSYEVALGWQTTLP